MPSSVRAGQHVALFQPQAQVHCVQLDMSSVVRGHSTFTDPLGNTAFPPSSILPECRKHTDADGRTAGCVAMLRWHCKSFCDGWLVTWENQQLLFASLTRIASL